MWWNSFYVHDCILQNTTDTVICGRCSHDSFDSFKCHDFYYEFRHCTAPHKHRSSIHISFVLHCQFMVGQILSKTKKKTLFIIGRQLVFMSDSAFPRITWGILHELFTFSEASCYVNVYIALINEWFVWMVMLALFRRRISIQITSDELRSAITTEV